VVVGYLGSLSFVIVYFGSLVCGFINNIFIKTITITELLVPLGQLQEFIFGDIIAAGYDVGIFF
jgi:hypothetical protein